MKVKPQPTPHRSLDAVPLGRKDKTRLQLVERTEAAKERLSADDVVRTEAVDVVEALGVLAVVAVKPLPT